MLDTATWRANPDWGAELGLDLDELADANRAAVAFARELAAGREGVTINGMLGPRGDGYVVGERMSVDEAADYHGWQIGVLAEAGVERITVLTMTYPEEAAGIVRAATQAGLPVVPGFTVETDGRLPSGISVAEAIEQVDAATDGAAAFFMINCAHPQHVTLGLGGEAALARVGGLRMNASSLSHAELDVMEELDEGDPVALGRETAALRELLPELQLLGGCCGTDHRHVAEVIRAWDAG